MIIRPASLNDLSSIMKIEKACFDEKTRETSFLYEHRIINECVYVAEIEDGIVGCIVLEGKNFIASNAVLPEHRNLGVSRKMLRVVISLADPVITLTVDPKWVSVVYLYESGGFIITGMTESGRHKMKKVCSLL